MADDERPTPVAAGIEVKRVQAVGEPLILIPREHCNCAEIHPLGLRDGSVDHTDMCYMIGSEKIVADWRAARLRDTQEQERG